MNGAGEIAHQLRALAAILENLGLMHSTHMMAFNCLQLQF